MVLHFNLVEGSGSCEECRAAHSLHCSYQQPTVVWQFWAEQMHTPSMSSTQHGSPFFISFSFHSPDFPFLFCLLDIASCLRNLVAAWDCVSAAYDSLEADLVSYHNQVSEFAEELLLADGGDKSKLVNYWGVSFYQRQG